MNGDIIFSPTILGILDDTPRVSLSEFVNNSQPGDVITSFLKSDSFSSSYRLILSRALGLSQGSKFTSLKMVDVNHTIIGYGVESTDVKLDIIPKVDKTDMIPFLKNCGGAILIRPVNELDPKQISRALKYMRDRIGLDYDTYGLLKSTWDRFLDRRILPFNTDRLTKKDIDNYKQPLFCSTIINFAFLSAGVKLKLAKNNLDVWPRDFILSPDTWKVCYYKTN